MNLPPPSGFAIFFQWQVHHTEPWLLPQKGRSYRGLLKQLAANFKLFHGGFNH